jgi:hypothetical protein
VAYADVPAARHALARLKSMVAHPGEARHVQPMLWRFDQLDDPRWRETALRDACRASAVVLAMSDESGLNSQAESWLSALAAGQRGVRMNALIFVGNDEPWSITLQQSRPAAAAKAAPDLRVVPDLAEEPQARRALAERAA